MTDLPHNARSNAATSAIAPHLFPACNEEGVEGIEIFPVGGRGVSVRSELREATDFEDRKPKKKVQEDFKDLASVGQ